MTKIICEMVYKRPDMTQTAGDVSRGISDSGQENWEVVKRLVGKSMIVTEIFIMQMSVVTAPHGMCSL